MERYNKLCFTNYDGKRNSEVQDMILNDFKDNIIDTFNYSFITEDQNVIYEEKNVVYEITSTKCKNHYKTTTIDLGECEFYLKNYYGINFNESLYIFKVDAFVDGKIGSKVEYEVYYPFDSSYLKQLDLSICEGLKIYIGYPLNISEEELELYNSKSPFYNDICYTYTNSKGADVTLYDRQNEYFNNNKSICEENCGFSGYDKVKGRLICSCEVKYSISMISEIKVEKNKLYNFLNLKQIANSKVMKCIKLLFSIKGVKTNIGFYSFFPTLISYIIALFIFYLIEFKRIKKQINEIISAKKIMKYSKYKTEKIEPEKNVHKAIKKKNHFLIGFLEKQINLTPIKEKKLSIILIKKRKITI